MKRIKILLVVGILGLFLNSAIKCNKKDHPNPSRSSNEEISTTVVEKIYKCEGKKRCHEMYSCDEATFYLKYCPNVKIDGDADGIPCEHQLCGR